jgi:hypothetical protein
MKIMATGRRCENARHALRLREEFPRFQQWIDHTFAGLFRLQQFGKMVKT